MSKLNFHYALLYTPLKIYVDIRIKYSKWTDHLWQKKLYSKIFHVQIWQIMHEISILLLVSHICKHKTSNSGFLWEAPFYLCFDVNRVNSIYIKIKSYFLRPKSNIWNNPPSCRLWWATSQNDLCHVYFLLLLDMGGCGFHLRFRIR